jgi:hypothetical protein
MHRLILFPVILAVAACDNRKSSVGSATTSTGSETTVAVVVTTTPVVVTTAADRKIEVPPPPARPPQTPREQEEERLAIVAPDFRLLGAEDQSFVLDMRTRLSKRPIELLDKTEDRRLRGLTKFINAEDMFDYWREKGKSCGSDELAKVLTLNADQTAAFKVRFGQVDYDIVTALRFALTDVAEHGLSGSAESSRKLIAQEGFTKFVVRQ